MNMLILTAFAAAYRDLIANPSRQVPFWILAGFLPAFVITRLVVYTAPAIFLVVNGTHVHHFTYGIIVLALTGFVSLVWTQPKRVVRSALAVFYGVGLALAFDEFSMWLRLTNDYNADQSEVVMVGIFVFLVVFVYGFDIARRTLFHHRRLQSGK